MKKNLILVSLDTVRADVAYNGKFEAIEKLRNVGATFSNTISSSPLTPVSHSTVFTGLQPFNHGVRHLFKEKINKDVPVLAEILKSEGYRTGAIVSCPGMNNWYGLSRGFDHYDDEIPRLQDGSDPLESVDVKVRGTAMKRAEVVVDKAKEWLSKNKDSNFFLFLHFFDAHWPYQAPKKFGGKNAYEEEVAYTDHYLNLFIDYLIEENLYSDSLIVVFSDHGEDLDGLYKDDKGGKKFGHPEEFGHGCLLYNQTQKVVLIIKDKLIKDKTEISAQVRLVDIAPTILQLLNIENKQFVFDGTSLVPYLTNRNLNTDLIGYSETFYSEEQNAATDNRYPQATNKKSITIGNKYKVIFNIDSDLVEVYDLIQDENETINLLTHPDISQKNNPLRSKQWWENFWKNEKQDFGKPTQELLNYALTYKNGHHSKLEAIDIASGNGRYAVPLAKMGFAVDALELTRMGEKRIIKSGKKEHVKIKTETNDFLKIIEDPRQYDLLLCSGLLEEVDQKYHKQVVEGFMSWTKPGGINIIKYCLEIVDRGKMVKENFVPNLYRKQGWKIIGFEQDKALRKSKANITFEKQIRTETLVALKPDK